MFVDEVDIEVTAGHGGRGAMSFRREKFVPRGGPDGGDGGNGGSIYIVASPHINTLVNFRFHPEFQADRGKHGQGSNRRGGNGRDLEIPVPIGTLVYEHDPEDGSWRPLVDLTEEGARALIADGGRGGFGNAYFATSTNSAPRKFQPGLPGEQKRLRLHLKLLADVGLVGLSEQREVHADRTHLRGAAEDRRLPVHDAHAESRRCTAQRQPQLRGR